MRPILTAIETGRMCAPVSDWYKTLGFLDLHRIAGLVADRFSDAPPQATRHLTIQKRYQAYRQAKLHDAALPIAAALRAARIPHAFLKGMALVPLYEAGERCSNDIDILTAPPYVGKVSAVLKESGYTQGVYRAGALHPFSREEIVKRRMNRGETAPFVKLEADGLCPVTEVDVNFSLNWLPNGAEEKLAGFLDHTTQVSGLTVLDDAHCLLFLCLHLYKEAVVYSMVRRGKDIELYKYVDILRMLPRVDLDRFWTYAADYGVEGECRYVLYHTALLFPSCGLRLDEPRDADIVFDPERGGKRYRWNKDFLARLDDTARWNGLEEIPDGNA